MDYLARPNPRKGERLRFRAHGPLGSGDNLSPLDVRKEYFRALEIDRLERIARKHPIEFVEEKDGIVVGRLSP